MSSLVYCMEVQWFEFIFKSGCFSFLFPSSFSSLTEEEFFLVKTEVSCEPPDPVSIFSPAKDFTFVDASCFFYSKKSHWAWLKKRLLVNPSKVLLFYLLFIYGQQIFIKMAYPLFHDLPLREITAGTLSFYPEPLKTSFGLNHCALDTWRHKDVVTFSC